MSATLTLPDTPPFAAFGKQLKQAGYGIVRTADGTEYVVMEADRLYQLESILSDPEFLGALERGVSDAVRGRVRTLQSGRTLQDLAEGSLPCDASMASAVERGVDDALAGRVRTLKDGQSPADLL
jgi:hypothetical protein